jgi:hypothetical protein
MSIFALLIQLTGDPPLAVEDPNPLISTAILKRYAPVVKINIQNAIEATKL